MPCASRQLFISKKYLALALHLQYHHRGLAYQGAVVGVSGLGSLDISILCHPYSSSVSYTDLINGILGMQGLGSPCIPFFMPRLVARGRHRSEKV